MCPATIPDSPVDPVDCRYISEVAGGSRRVLRILLDSVRKTEYRRRALVPGVDGRPRWEFPTVWLMRRHTGYWQSTAHPKMEENIQINLEGCAPPAGETA